MSEYDSSNRNSYENDSDNDPGGSSGEYHFYMKKGKKKTSGGKGRKMKKTVRWIVTAAVGAAAAAILAAGSAYQIQEQEQAVVTTFGVPRAVTETGLHFKIPFVQNVSKVNTTIQGFPIGYEMENNDVVESEGIMITSDYNFINVDFFVEYRIDDPVKYLYTAQAPEDILKNISQSCIRSAIASYSVDDVLTTGKSEIQGKIREMVTEQIEERDIGIQLVNITIQDSEPPTQEVMQSFKAVETAKQGKETALNNANKYRNEKLPEAEAKADQIIQDAEAEKEVRINEAEAEVARFNAMYEEYSKNPEVTKLRMFYEAMEEVLPDMKLIIDSGDGVQKVLPLDSFTGTSEERGGSSGNSTDTQSSGSSADTQSIGGSTDTQSAGENSGGSAQSTAGASVGYGADMEE